MTLGLVLFRLSIPVSGYEEEAQAVDGYQQAGRRNEIVACSNRYCFEISRPSATFDCSWLDCSLVALADTLVGRIFSTKSLPKLEPAKRVCNSRKLEGQDTPQHLSVGFRIPFASLSSPPMASIDHMANLELVLGQ